MMLNPNQNIESSSINKENSKSSTEASSDQTLKKGSTFNLSAAQMAATGFPYPFPYFPHDDSYMLRMQYSRQNPNQIGSAPINKENSKQSTEGAPDQTLNKGSTFNFPAAQMAETGFLYSNPFFAHDDSYMRMYHSQPNMFTGAPPSWGYYPNDTVPAYLQRSTKDCDPRPTSSLDVNEVAPFQVIPEAIPDDEEARKMTEAPFTGENEGMIYVDRVRDTDVLCGRGGRSNHHTGNKMFRKVVEDMKVTYKGAGEKKTKTKLSRTIVEHVYNYGGRFIKQDKRTGKYFLLTPAEARRKTSQALREIKK